MKVLNIIESAYRGTLEEQDDTIVWLSHALVGAGAKLDVLLLASAVNYGVLSQDAGGLRFGDQAQTQPPHLAEDVARLMEKGCAVYLVQEDCAERGLEPRDLVPGLKTLGRARLPQLFEEYDQVWHW